MTKCKALTGSAVKGLTDSTVRHSPTTETAVLRAHCEGAAKPLYLVFWQTWA